MSTSISSCGEFPGHVNVNYPRGHAVVHYNNQTFRKGLNQWLFNIFDDDRIGYIGIETDLINATHGLSMITDMKVCQLNYHHYLAQCVDGTNHSECYNTGCFNWDPQDSPMSYELDIIVNGEVTPLAMTSNFQASGCYHNDEYDSALSTICATDKCDNSLEMDDYFRFKFRPFTDIGTLVHDIFVFDVKYRQIYCDFHGRRRLLSSETTDHYAMAVVKFVNV